MQCVESPTSLHFTQFPEQFLLVCFSILLYLTVFPFTRCVDGAIVSGRQVNLVFKMMSFVFQ